MKKVISGLHGVMFLLCMRSVRVLVLFLVVNYVMVCYVSCLFLLVPFCSNHSHSCYCVTRQWWPIIGSKYSLTFSVLFSFFQFLFDCFTF